MANKHKNVLHFIIRRKYKLKPICGAISTRVAKINRQIIPSIDKNVE